MEQLKISLAAPKAADYRLMTLGKKKKVQILHVNVKPE
jgi:hypothetical protein